MSEIPFTVVVSVDANGEPVVGVRCERCAAELSLEAIPDHVRGHRREERVNVPPVQFRLVVGPTPGEALGALCTRCTEVITAGEVRNHAQRHWDEGPAS